MVITYRIANLRVFIFGYFEEHHSTKIKLFKPCTSVHLLTFQQYENKTFKIKFISGSTKISASNITRYMVYCHNAQKEMANTEESYSQYYVYVHVFRMPGVSGRGWRNLKGCSRPMLWMSNTQWAVGCQAPRNLFGIWKMVE